jgi:DOPA 4,5-dioxygenase
LNSYKQYPVNVHKAYHAHIYFDKNTLEHATTLSNQAGKLFGLEIGRVHQKPVGPHPMWSCQILFHRMQFDELIPWLNENRKGLTVFVHPLTGDDILDHTKYAYWLGESVELNLVGL